ncbi:complement C2-like [Gastrophryne carolinensis]
MASQCALPSWTLPLTFLLLPILTAGEAQVQCPSDAGFPNGLTHLTDGLNVGSVANFMCPTGQYPWPASSRTCLDSGQWSAMTTRSGRKRTRIQCQNIKCPEPVGFENGEYYPRGPYLVGSNITFVCNDGYIPRGSMERTCKRNGRWSGETVVCDDGAGHCADPGVPLGALKTGNRYDIGESVSYTCDRDLILMGSAKRTCQENRRWSGTEVNCQTTYSFDLPEDVGQYFAGSLSGVLKTSKKRDDTVERTVKIEQDGILNVYLLLDASKSVGEQNFQISKECAKILVDTLGKFDMKIEFGIMSYATEPITILNVFDQDASDPDEVLAVIEDKLKYSAHNSKSGTNIKAALIKLRDMIAFQKTKYKKDEWNSVHHVIILLTDGKSNMGGRPLYIVKSIQNDLNITKEREDYLDIYAFGIGNDIDEPELNELASKKDNEKHVFKLQNADDLKAVFKLILDIKKFGDMCGLNDEYSEENKKLFHPWNVFIESPTGSPCLGSLISKQWVLTAAHCFKADVEARNYGFNIGGNNYNGERIEIHDCYNVRRKKDLGINEDYDYDVALVKLNKEVTFTKSASPICIPCTEPANRAMKKPKTATCQDHRVSLLASSDISAGFLYKPPGATAKKEVEEQRVTIKYNNARDACISTIKRQKEFENINPQDLVSPRHLCVEGDEGMVSCKGESGGSLFVDLRQRQRFFQVGILSFGIFDPCKKSGTRLNSANARDFHVNVLEVLPFLRKHLVGELEFLPGIPSAEEVICPS